MILSLLLLVLCLSLTAGMAIGGTSSWALEIDQCRAKHWEIPLNSFDDPKILHEIDRDIGKYDAGHRGVDLKGNVGDVIHAPESGKILWKGVVGGKPTFTYQVDDLKLTFTPASTARSVGESVRKGEALGTLTQNNDGSNHCIDSVCLHWGVVDDQDNYLDPKAFVYRPRIVLKRILG